MRRVLSVLLFFGVFAFVLMPAGQVEARGGAVPPTCTTEMQTVNECILWQSGDLAVIAAYGSVSYDKMAGLYLTNLATGNGKTVESFLGSIVIISGPSGSTSLSHKAAYGTATVTFSWDKTSYRIGSARVSYDYKPLYNPVSIQSILTSPGSNYHLLALGDSASLQSPDSAQTYSFRLQSEPISSGNSIPTGGVIAKLYLYNGRWYRTTVNVYLYQGYAYYGTSNKCTLSWSKAGADIVLFKSTCTK